MAKPVSSHRIEHVRGIVEDDNAAQINHAAELVIKSATQRRANNAAVSGIDPFSEIGVTGLRQFGGFVLEEWLTTLQGRKGAWFYREMLDNDPVVGSIMFAIQWLANSVEWRVEDGAKPEDAEFLRECMDDMDHTWADFIAEALPFLAYGWSLHEEVYKRRQGEQPGPPPLEDDAGAYTSEDVSWPASSRYTDGRVGWRKLNSRAQETLLRWGFDGYSTPIYMEQIDWHGGNHRIPLAKSILFRTKVVRNNPEGRALDLQTPIPTPDGWRTMADLTVGARVFDEAGRIRYVTAVQDWDDRPCFRLTFADGCEIIADANHEWITQKVWERQTRRPPRIRTTAEIAASTKDKAGVTNHGIAWAGALDYTEQHLSVDPYVLGLWLGDGAKTSARITCHVADIDEQERLITDCGYTVVRRDGSPRDGDGRVLDVQGSARWAADSPQAALRALGVLGNKHVPAHFLRGSCTQRLALLQGLMDSDGSVDSLGRCEFSNTNTCLIEAVAELVRSLGCGCRVALKHRAGDPQHAYGERRIRHAQDGYVVKFSPSAFVPFRLSRKAARVQSRDRKRQFHYIVSVEPATNRRTRCIEVDSPSHLYLAGTSMVPTHNSIMRNAVTSYLGLKHLKAIEGIGIERDLAGVPVATPPDGVDLTSQGQSALYQKVKDMVTSLRNDEYSGIVLPQAGWKLELMTTGGSRQFDVDKTIRRYRQDIALSMLADWVLIGQDAVGSFALVEVKTDIFGVALDGILDLICAQLNRVAVPRLFRLNGMDVTDPPRIAHGSARKIDLDRVGSFLQAIALAGAPIPWSVELLTALFADAGLPANLEEQKDRADELPAAPRQPDPQDDLQGERVGAEQQRAGLMKAGDGKLNFCVDFDGVIRRKGPHAKADEGEPMPGAADGLAWLEDHYHVVILTARKNTGKVSRWLTDHGMGAWADRVTNKKPPAVEYLDDHGAHFTSWAATMDRLRRPRRNPTPPERDAVMVAEVRALRRELAAARARAKQPVRSKRAAARADGR